MKAQNLDLSEFARKYGAYPGFNISGYTPLASLFPGQSENQEVVGIEDFQRSKLGGFTSRELADLDAISSRQLKPSDLRNEIVPLLRQDRWEKKPNTQSFYRYHLYPLGNGKGNWVAENKEVWTILHPILKIASRILISAHLLPWFDALMEGDRVPIDVSRIAAAYRGKPLESFWPRQDLSNPEYIALRRDVVLQSLRTKWNLTFGFMSPTEDPRGLLGPNVLDADAVTITNDGEMDSKNPNSKWGIWIYLDYSIVEPLLRDDLNSSERMSVEWATANILVHEIMHAIGKIVPHDGIAPTMAEPYFEDEVISELGWSFENAVNGGCPDPFLKSLGLPLGYWINAKWPTYAQFALSDGTEKLETPKPYLYQLSFPIPLSFYENIQQEEFWNVGVRTFGHGLLYYNLFVEGARVDYTVTQHLGKYSCAQGTPFRISSQHIPEYKERTTTIRNQIQALHTLVMGDPMLILPPDERNALDFGRQLLIRMETDRAFWHDSKRQQAEVEKLIRHDGLRRSWQETYAGSPTTKPLRAIVRLLEQTRERHERMIAALLALEYTDGREDTERRRNLLDWNRGTRTFADGLRSHCLHPSLSRLSLDNDILALEFCRMRIWTPLNTSLLNGPDSAEMAKLRLGFDCLGVATQESKDSCRQHCIDVRGDPGCSLFARSCTEIMFMHLDDLSDLDIRLRTLKSNVEQLSVLRTGSIAEWTATVAVWENMGRDLIVNLQSRRDHGRET